MHTLLRKLRPIEIVPYVVAQLISRTLITYDQGRKKVLNKKSNEGAVGRRTVRVRKDAYAYNDLTTYFSIHFILASADKYNYKILLQQN